MYLCLVEVRKCVFNCRFNVDEELENVDKKQDAPKPKVSESKSLMNVPPVSTKG